MAIERIMIGRLDLNNAVEQGIINSEQADSLWHALELGHSEAVQESSPDPGTFTGANVAYFLGALIVMAALGWLMSNSWDSFGGGGIMGLALMYAVLFAFAGHTLWFGEERKVPGGLLFTMAVWMVPLAIYGFERMMGWWPKGDPGHYRDYYVWIKGSWFFMEVGTIAAGLLTIRFVRFPFLSFPVAFALWFMSMDAAELIFRYGEDFSWSNRRIVSLGFGVLMITAAYLMDQRTNEDYSFWGYLFGATAFWGSLSMMDSGSELGKFLYCMINLGMIFLAVFLDRRVFVVYGALGVNGYLGYLSYSVFKDSVLFPFALVAFGIFVIFAGLQYQRNQSRIEGAILSGLPESLRQMRPANRATS